MFYITDVTFLVLVIFHILSKVDSSRHCTYVYESGLVKHFSCGIYEFCCGSTCCRSRVIGFYQMWYFWLMVLLLLLLCSGGGWWYRYGHWETHQHIPWPSATTAAVPRNRHQQPMYPPGTYPQLSPQYGPQPSYPSVNPDFHASQASNRQNVPPTFPPSDPPPPYTGPPPSYSSVVGNTATNRDEASNNK